VILDMASELTRNQTRFLCKLGGIGSRLVRIAQNRKFGTCVRV